MMVGFATRSMSMNAATWYARAMASYGLLQGLTGVCFDAVDQTLYIDSKVGDFTSFISTEKGFGTVTLPYGKEWWVS